MSSHLISDETTQTVLLTALSIYGVLGTYIFVTLLGRKSPKDK